MAATFDLLLPFAISIHAKCVALRSLDLSKAQKRRFIESLRDDIKKSSTFFQPEASEAALGKALDLNVNIWIQGWHNQSSFDKGPIKLFHLEHVKPVSAIGDVCLECRTAEEVRSALLAHIRIAWILTTENEELTRLGYRTRRPDPDAAYTHAKICLRKRRQFGACEGMLVTLKEDDEHLEDFADYM